MRNGTVTIKNTGEGVISVTLLEKGAKKNPPVLSLKDGEQYVPHANPHTLGPEQVAVIGSANFVAPFSVEIHCVPPPDNEAT